MRYTEVRVQVSESTDNISTTPMSTSAPQHRGCDRPRNVPLPVASPTLMLRSEPTTIRAPGVKQSMVDVADTQSTCNDVQVALIPTTGSSQKTSGPVATSSMCLRPRRSAVDYTVFFGGGGARATGPVGVGNRKRARRSTDKEKDAEHDDESVEQGGGDPVLTRRSVDGGEEEERSDESVGEVDTKDEADGDEAGDVGCDCDLELDVKKSAVYRHLVGHPDCCHSYSDFFFHCVVSCKSYSYYTV